MYEVTSSDINNLTVSYRKPPNKTGSSIKIPATITINEIRYKVTAIADNALRGNTGLKTVKIGNNITKIGKKAFMGCTSLKKVTIGPKIQVIDDNAFRNCTKLKKIQFSKGITKIGSNAFKQCKLLRKIILPNTLRKIDSNVFNGCTALKTLVIKSKKLNKHNVSSNALKGLTKKVMIKVPKSKVTSYKKLFQNKGLNKKIKVKAL